MKVYRLAHTDLAHEAIAPSPAQGRWNEVSYPALYTSEHSALAALEMLNYWDDYISMNGYYYTVKQMLIPIFRLKLHTWPRMQVSGLILRCNYVYEIDILDEVEDAPSGINHHDLQQTRDFGTRWLIAKTALALRVRSVCTPIGFNYVLNGKHTAYSLIRVTQQHPQTCVFKN